MLKIDQEKLNKFSGEFSVQMIVIFGSAVKNQKQPEDFDVALFMPDEKRVNHEEDMSNYSRLWMKLAEALAVSPDKLDITFVSPKTPPLLLYHIAKDGRLFYGRRSDFSLFQLKAIKIFFDSVLFRRATDKYLEKFLTR